MVLAPQAFSKSQLESTQPNGQPEKSQTRPSVVYKNTPFQMRPVGAGIEEQEQADKRIYVAGFGDFAREGRHSLQRSGKFGLSDTTSKGQSAQQSNTFFSRNGNPQADANAVSNILKDGGGRAEGLKDDLQGFQADFHGLAPSGNTTGNSTSGRHEENRKSGGARGQLRDNILQQMKEPKMPVYYENHEGTRFSILSEMI